MFVLTSEQSLFIARSSFRNVLQTHNVIYLTIYGYMYAFCNIGSKWFSGFEILILHYMNEYTDTYTNRIEVFLRTRTTIKVA